MTTKYIIIFRDVDMIGGNFIYTRSAYNSGFWLGFISGTFDAGNINFECRNGAYWVVHRIDV